MTALDAERDVWDARYRSALTDDGHVVRQCRVGNVMHLPEPIHTMLDVGCGVGDTVVAWAEHGAAATGIDISAEAVQCARNASRTAGCAAKCRFVVGDWAALDLDAYGWRGAFDLVFSAMGPDMTEPAALRKMMACSRKYCRLLLFRDGRNALAEKVSKRLCIPLPQSPPSGEARILSQLCAYAVSAEDVVYEISFAAHRTRWRAYLQTLFPAREHAPVLDQIVQTWTEDDAQMVVQTEAVYRMLTWRV